VDLRLRNESDILNTLLIVSVIILVLLVVVGARVGWVIAGRVLRPLQAINRAAKVASTGSLHHRVGLAGPHDEIQDLSDTFDDMLGKLDGAFKAYQRFAANASHELRTPLATTQTILDVALADPELDVDDLRKVSERVREMNHRNIETVEALLKLAELDQTPLLRDEIDVSALLRSVVDRLAHEIDAERLHVTVPDAPHGVRGDPVLIRQLLVNLVQNAVRHNQPGGTVHVTVEDHAEAGEVLLRIVNTGDAVSPESIGSLVEPFFRTRGRTTQTRASHNGHGLGLAIVSAIVKAHDGRLTMEANPGGGLTVEVVLPR
jgi:two-component system sensor histidine kinase VanS